MESWLVPLILVSPAMYCSQNILLSLAAGFYFFGGRLMVVSLVARHMLGSIFL